MPKYHATRTLNKREAEYIEFDAHSDEDALAIIKSQTSIVSLGDWESVENSDCTPDACDVRLSLDRINDQASSKRDKYIELFGGFDAITLKSEMPYSRDSREFVKKVAELREAFSSYYDEERSHAMLSRLIEEARKLCGKED